MMIDYKDFVFDYDKNAFNQLFNDGQKQSLDKRTNLVITQKDLDDGIIGALMDNFDFIPKRLESVEFSNLTQDQLPHVNGGNNGFLLFPVSGSVDLKIYYYIPESVDKNGRPFIDTEHMTPQQIQAIEDTIKESLELTSPIAINGMVSQRLTLNKTPAIFLVLKIPLTMQFDKVVEILDSYNAT